VAENFPSTEKKLDCLVDVESPDLFDVHNFAMQCDTMI
jgi:hypothetical protein